MKLEKQVVSLELAKKLKKLGVTQQSLFYWFNGEIFFEKDNLWISPFKKAGYSAFTASELGEMLPQEIERPNPNYEGKYGADPYKNELNFLSYNGGHPCYTYGYDLEWGPDYLDEDTEADARAKMLIYLIENKLMEVEQ